MKSPNGDKNPDQDNNPEISIQKQDSSMQVSATECIPELDAVLASVIRVFAARGRAIREDRAKQEKPQLQYEGEDQPTADEADGAGESTMGSEAQ